MKALLDTLLPVLKSGVPLIITLLVGVTVLVLARKVLFKRRAWLGVNGGLYIQLILLCLTGAVIVAIILALPISDTSKGELMSLLGLLITAAIALSSTTFVGNAMAGLMLRALSNFRPGDFLKVENHFGRVTELGLLHTEIQTEDRDLTTLPNLYLVTHPTSIMPETGAVVSATVSLGYDTSREKIEAALLRAARTCELEDAFVQVLDLGDYSVTYRAAGFLKEAKFVLSVRSKLRASIMDALHGADIEIVSPTFMNQRQFPNERVFLPERHWRRPFPKPEAPLPEERIFDKAEAAEGEATRAEALVELERKITELTEQVEKTASGPERDDLLRVIIDLEARRDKLTGSEEMPPEDEESPPPDEVK